MQPGRLLEHLGILLDLVGHVAVGLLDLDLDLRLGVPLADTSDDLLEVLFALLELLDAAFDRNVHIFVVKSNAMAREVERP